MKIDKYFTFTLILIWIVTSCQSSYKEEFQLFNLLKGEQTNILFNNQIIEHDTLNPSNYYYIYNGAGVAIADIDNDGLEDVFLAGNMISSRLYLNKGNLKFEDITEKSGVTTDRWCTGVSTVDINTDGFLDFYVCVADRNYTEKGRNLLYVNNGDNTFTEKAKEYGLDDADYSTHAAFLDYDLDGDLDMYLLTGGVDESVSQNNIQSIKINGEDISTDKLYRNNGDNTFSNVSKEAGITIEGYGLGVAIVDINKDGYPDIYASNDFIYNDLLYINNGDGTFSNKLEKYMRQTPHNGMGLDAADYNNDGLVDFVTVDMLPDDNKRQKSMMIGMNYDKFQAQLRNGYHPQFVRNTLQLNNGNGSFSEVGRLAEIYKTDWSWAPLLIDVDNDGLRDLFISNGYARDITDLDYVIYGVGQKVSLFGTKESKDKRHYELVKALPGIHVSNYFYKNEGDLSFSDKSKAWGIQIPSYSNGCAYADLDNDGDVDFLINNVNEHPFVYENRSELKETTEKNNYIRIRLEGTKLNSQGLGAKIKVVSGDIEQYHEHYLSRGYKSTMENVIHLGLGKNTKVDDIEVVWQEGKISRLKNIKVNQEITIKFSDAKNEETHEKTLIDQKTLFTEIDINESGINFLHKENYYVDFKQHPLLQQMYSRNGPGIAVGDIDGNGFDDFYIGEAFNHQGSFFLQREEGTFITKFLEDGKNHEDMGALLFDADNDGDLDLYAVSGGVAAPLNSKKAYYQDRLYLNDGKGNFQLNEEALPKLEVSGSCVIAADFDRDDDLDLFIGGRIIPNQYPQPATSYLLRNESGRFERVEIADFDNLGLVTSAIWTDFDNDNWLDLMVVGEWMSPKFFKNQKGVLKDITKTSGVSGQKGFWNSISAGDFDNDGDMDYLVGNLGLNSQLKATSEEPVSIIAKDFDNNGSYDPIITYYNQGKAYPLHTRDALISQINAFRARYQKYADYGNIGAHKIFAKTDLIGSLQLKVTNLESSLIENLGNGQFRLKPLPKVAQLAPAFGIIVNDFNEDENLDALIVGNLRSTELVSGYYDASIGNCLLGDGKGNFKNIPTTESGVYIEGDAKGIVKVDGKQTSYLLIPHNSGEIKMIKQNRSFTQNISLQPFDIYAEVHFSDKVQRVEFHYGSGYLSQSSRNFSIPNYAQKIFIYNNKGEKREVILENSLSLR